MQPPQHENASPTVLTYGTHDRAGPWWRRWLRAWGRAARPAAITSLVVGVLAYATGRREYTATATMVVHPGRPSVVYPSSTASLQSTAKTVARSAPQHLYAVLRSPPWNSGRGTSPPAMVPAPISADVITGTNIVRVHFTDYDRDRARIGADVIAQEMTRDDDARTARLSDMRQRVAAELTAAQRSGEVAALEMKLQQTLARIRQLEIESGGFPRARTGSPAIVARFATNQRQLLMASVRAAAVAFPVAGVVALYWRWSYRRHATA